MRSPLHHSPKDVSVGAALATGLLHKLRGAPSQERNAILTGRQSDMAMLSTFSGHGAHGLRLSEAAAAVVFRHMRRALPALSADVTAAVAASGSSLSSYVQRDAHVQAAMIRVVRDAFVDAYAALGATLWARSSGVSATVCVVRKGKLVVGACGLPTVLAVSRRNGRATVELLTGRAMHVGDGATVASVFAPAHVHGDGSASDPEVRCGSDRGASDGTRCASWTKAPPLQSRLSLPQAGLRQSQDAGQALGCCERPTMRAFDVSARHSHVVVSTMRLWAGDDAFAPQRVADVFGNPDECVIDLAERLMRVCFGAGGPTHDASILCTRLR